MWKNRFITNKIQDLFIAAFAPPQQYSNDNRLRLPDPRLGRAKNRKGVLWQPADMQRATCTQWSSCKAFRKTWEGASSALQCKNMSLQRLNSQRLPHHFSKVSATLLPRRSLQALLSMLARMAITNQMIHQEPLGDLNVMRSDPNKQCYHCLSGNTNPK